MKKNIRLTESDLVRLVKRVINEQESFHVTRDKVESKEKIINFIISSLNTMKKDKNADIDDVVKNLTLICKDIKFLTKDGPSPVHPIMSPSPSKNPMGGQ